MFDTEIKSNHKERPMEELKQVHEISIRRADVEKFLIAVKELSLPFKLNHEMRVTINYDPQKPGVVVKYFIPKNEERYN